MLIASPASAPMTVFLSPELIAVPALSPTAVLYSAPEPILSKAVEPIAVLPVPVDKIPAFP